MIRNHKRRATFAGLVAVALMAGLVASFPTSAFAAHGAGCLDVEPETATSPAASPYVVTATNRTAGMLLACDGAPVAPATPMTVSFEVREGPNQGATLPSCTITPPETSCESGPYTSSETGTDEIIGWVDDPAHPRSNDEPADETDPEWVLTGDDPNTTDVVTKTWTTGTENRLDCDDSSGDETATKPHDQGAASSELYNCKVTDASGNVKSGISVYGENRNGANDPDNGTNFTTPDYGGCTTSAQGTCQFSISQESPPQPGTAQLCFWAGATTDGEALCASEPTTEAEGNDAADQAEVTWAVPAATNLDATPEFDTNQAGTEHSISVTLYDQNGFPYDFAPATVKFEFFQGSPKDTDGNTPASPDGTCTTKKDEASCSFLYTSSVAGTDRVCAWLGANPTMSGTNVTGTCNSENRTDTGEEPGSPQTPPDDRVDVVEAEWVSPAPTSASRLSCTQETDSNPTNTSHQITCAATNGADAVVPGANIDVEATGVNDPDGNVTLTDPDFTCVANAQGQCSFIHGAGGKGTTGTAGQTVYRAWVDIDGDNATSEADATEGQDETTTPGATVEPDGTEVVTKDWVATVSTLQMTPEADTAEVGVCNPYTILALDSTGAPVPGVVLDIEQVHEAATNASLNDEPDVSFCVPTFGPNTSTVNTAAGDRQPPSESPDNLGTNGGEIVKATDAAGRVTIGIQVAATGASDGSGVVTVTAFFEGDNDQDPEAGEPADTSTKTWTVPDDKCQGFENLSGDHIVGTEDDDVLVGTEGDDVICGLGGDDTIEGLGGHDLLVGGDGDDLVSGDAGIDDIRGDDGLDELQGDTGNDILKGGNDDDVLNGGASNDRVSGGTGNDVHKGGAGKDSVKGGPGNDLCDGGPGRDRCKGGPGKDKIKRCETGDPNSKRKRFVR